MKGKGIDRVIKIVTCLVVFVLCSTTAIHGVAMYKAWNGNPEMLNKIKQLNAPYVLIKYEK